MRRHPTLLKILAAVVPFVGGVVFYFIVANYAPSYPQSIRNRIAAHLQGTPTVPVEPSGNAADSSTTRNPTPEKSPKPYSTSAIGDKNVNQTGHDNARNDENSVAVGDSATWNSTNGGLDSLPPTPDVVGWSESQAFEPPPTPDTQAKLRQIEALSDASSRGAVRACIESLVDEDPAVRRHAASAIARANGPALYREWINILLHGPQPLLAELDALLPTLGEPLEPNALADLASGESLQQEKLAAMYTLGRVRSSSAIAILTGYAWSEDPLIAQTATAALAEIRSPDAVGALTDLTAHYDPDVRWYATNGLGLVQTNDAAVALEAVLLSYEEPVTDIRALAAGHLGQTRELASAHALVESIRRFPGVRPAAMYALSELTGIEEFIAPHQWYMWYDEWSQTPEAEAAVRITRTPPRTDVAVMPVGDDPAPDPAPARSAPTPEAVARAPRTAPPAEPAPESIDAQPVASSPTTETAVPETEPSKPVTAKLPPTPPENNGKGGFSTSDLTPAELMRRGGFGKSNP